MQETPLVKHAPGPSKRFMSRHAICRNHWAGGWSRVHQFTAAYILWIWSRVTSQRTLISHRRILHTGHDAVYYQYWRRVSGLRTNELDKIYIAHLLYSFLYNLLPIISKGTSYVSEGFISPWTKWPPFHRRYFQVHFRERKVFVFWLKFHWICSQGPVDNISALV